MRLSQAPSGIVYNPSLKVAVDQLLVAIGEQGDVVFLLADKRVLVFTEKGHNGGESRGFRVFIDGKLLGLYGVASGCDLTTTLASELTREFPDFEMPMIEGSEDGAIEPLVLEFQPPSKADEALVKPHLRSPVLRVARKLTARMLGVTER